MIRGDRLQQPLKFCLAALFALMLWARLLAPMGFMPSFVNGRIAIAPCPDSGIAAVSHGHSKHHGQSDKKHQPCPFAATAHASGLPDIAAAAPAPVVVAMATPRVDRPAAVVVRRFERPPAIGPPAVA